MTTPGAALAAAACAMVGARFRLGGRDPARGLDCIGLVAASLEAVGREVGPLPRYTLRTTDIARFLTLAQAVGLHFCAEESRAGDVLLCRPSAAQFHLAVRAGDGSIIHAHAGLQRVVRGPAPLAWPVQHRWRLT